MKKSIFKKILSILDSIEIQGVTLEEAVQQTSDKLSQENTDINFMELNILFQKMAQLHFFRFVPKGIDLHPAATVFSRSEPSSMVEALALFECFIHDASFHHFYHNCINENPYQSKIIIRDIFSETLFYDVLMESSLYEARNDKYRINSLLVSDAAHILMEFDQDYPLITTTLCALFTADIVNQEDISISYRNQSLKMIDYPYTKIITDILPRYGIPSERDETKALQAFYKDTLFHEFAHCCPLCGIDIPQMLIASHIKPFRDCAHIYECSDYHNGLLLCRNHDYLFDQGYISFDDNGKIIISSKLLEKENMQESFAIHNDDTLLKCYINKTRRMFLSYHRQHIFKQ